MDRRSFLRSIFAVGGAAVAASVLVPQSAEAGTLFDELKAIEAGTVVPEPDLPAENAAEAQYYGGGYRGGGYRGGGYRGRGFYGGPRYPYGGYRRPVRCWWGRDRWGQMVRRCAAW